MLVDNAPPAANLPESGCRPTPCNPYLPSLVCYSFCMQRLPNLCIPTSPQADQPNDLDEGRSPKERKIEKGLRLPFSRVH
eukprot:1159508-Pelagomonas_calceolata.AAC.2